MDKRFSLPKHSLTTCTSSPTFSYDNIMNSVGLYYRQTLFIHDHMLASHQHVSWNTTGARYTCTLQHTHLCLYIVTSVPPNSKIIQVLITGIFMLVYTGLCKSMRPQFRVSDLGFNFWPWFRVSVVRTPPKTIATHSFGIFQKRLTSL